MDESTFEPSISVNTGTKPEQISVENQAPIKNETFKTSCLD